MTKATSPENLKHGSQAIVGQPPPLKRTSRVRLPGEPLFSHERHVEQKRRRSRRRAAETESQNQIARRRGEDHPEGGEAHSLQERTSRSLGTPERDRSLRGATRATRLCIPPREELPRHGTECKGASEPPPDREARTKVWREAIPA